MKIKWSSSAIYFGLGKNEFNMYMILKLQHNVWKMKQETKKRSYSEVYIIEIGTCKTWYLL